MVAQAGSVAAGAMVSEAEADVAALEAVAGVGVVTVEVNSEVAPWDLEAV